jgi:hypothetical protein
MSEQHTYCRICESLCGAGPFGDRFGPRRSGISVKRLRAMKHGVVLAQHQPTGVQRKRVRQAGFADRDSVRIVSKTGAIELPALVTDEIIRGAVAVPHGWGHGGGSWSRANAAGGANVNVLSSGAPEDLERLAGMTLLDGIRVRLEPNGGTG